jgi:hypothetical protein
MTIHGSILDIISSSLCINCSKAPWQRAPCIIILPPREEKQSSENRTVDVPEMEPTSSLACYSDILLPNLTLIH